MNPAQSEFGRFHFLPSAVAAIVTAALTAGVAYGVLGSDVRQNTQGLSEMRQREETRGSTVVDILVAQGKLEGKIDTLTSRIDTFAVMMERQYNRDILPSAPRRLDRRPGRLPETQ